MVFMKPRMLKSIFFLIGATLIGKMIVHTNNLF